MLFNSLEFWVFFAIVFGLYAVLPHLGRKVLLLAASYTFYGAWNWRFLFLLWFSTLLDYGVGRGLGAVAEPRRRKLLLTLSLTVNLGILAIFKYADFFSRSLASFLGEVGIDVSIATLGIVLPVGVSFYTFQAISYTVDVYRGRLQPTRKLLDFALFVGFFPQLVAGPIERATHLLPQIQTPRRVRWESIGSGGWLCLWGLFKKVVIADNLALLVSGVYSLEARPTGPEVLLATYAFAFQIYCDFSGYTDIARGTSRILGFDLIRNFDRPYFATSMTDFWHRWHISLSTWLRDYLYIPLGGNRRGVADTLRNLMITMVLGGLWHGAAWTFVAWGAYHGALLCAERLRPRPASSGAARTAVRWLVTFHLVCLGWLLFRAESMPHALALLTALVASPGLGLVTSWALPFAVLLVPLIVMELFQAKAGDDEIVLRCSFPVRTLVYTALISAMVILGEDGGSPFIYFQF